jgi:AcrR family transcriptional regulator
MEPPTARRATPKRAATRERLLEVALSLFRRRGFDHTSMREVASAAGLSVGAAYYHFPSKEAIVLAYYQRLQDEHAVRARAAMAAAPDGGGRIAAVLLTKLDVCQRDRKLLGALFRSLADPDDPLSLFGEGTRHLRDQSTAIFAEALAGEPLPPELRPLAARALWVAHLGILLGFLHDRSRGEQRTRRLAEVTADLFALAIPLAPVFRGRLLEIAGDLAT